MKQLILLIWTLLLVSCFAPRQEVVEEETSRPFRKPTVADFTGEFRLIDQQVAAEPPLLLANSRLFMRRDSTYEFVEYPVFRYRPKQGLVFKEFAHYSGHWTIRELGDAYDAASGKRQTYWGCKFLPVPGGERENFTEELAVDPYVDKKTGNLQALYFYYGDMDSGDYVLYERVAEPSLKKGN